MLKIRITLICLVFVILLSPAPGFASGDEYIRGYAWALFEKEFNLAPVDLRVENGTIRISMDRIDSTVRETMLSELLQIRGVKEVVIETGENESGLPSAFSGTGAETEPGKPDEPLRRFTEKKLLFAPLIADPRWPHFSIAYQYYINDEELKNVGFTSFGETLPLYTGDFPLGGQWQVGIQAAVFAIFDLDAASNDLINADYWVGFPVSYRHKDLSFFLRLFHQSSHLGDELLLRNRLDRINLSYETIDLTVSYYVEDWLRIYSGGGFIVRKDPEDIKPWSTQYGFELKSPRAYAGGTLKPVLGADFRHREESDWDADVSLRTGIEIESGKMLWNRLAFMLEYFNGYSPHGQFYKRSIEFLSIASHFYF